MSVSLKHKFQSAKSDGADTTIVRPSNWNDEHDLTLAAGKVLGRDTSGAGAVQELPIAVDTNGNVGIGSNPITGRSFTVSKNITGSVGSYSALVSGSIQSDVTTAAYLVGTSAITAAASFTLGSLVHFSASQSTFGAGSTVTNQYGFFVSSNLVGATNNYGVYSAIPAATGDWNFYAAGTADNYFAGSTGIGVAPATNTKLDVSGSVAQNVTAVAASAIDCSLGNYFTKTATGALSWTFTNVPASRCFVVILELTNGGTGTQSWPAAVKWPSATAPALTTSGVDLLAFITDDGGTTWRGLALMRDSR